MQDWILSIYDSFYKAIIPDQRYMAYIDGVKDPPYIFFAILLGIAIGMIVAVLKVTSTKMNWKWLSTLCNIMLM